MDVLKPRISTHPPRIVGVAYLIFVVNWDVDCQQTQFSTTLPRAVIMDLVSTAIVVAIVAALMLLGIGMVVNQLLRLRKWLNDSPPDTAPGEDAHRPPE
jgi:ABC-type Fe3+ transport system permease subunit